MHACMHDRGIDRYRLVDIGTYLGTGMYYPPIYVISHSFHTGAYLPRYLPYLPALGSLPPGPNAETGRSTLAINITIHHPPTS